MDKLDKMSLRWWGRDWVVEPLDKTTSTKYRAGFILEHAFLYPRILWSNKNYDNIAQWTQDMPLRLENACHEPYYRDNRAAYYQSRQWKVKYIRKMRQQNYICEDCKKNATQVHHLHYNTLYHENNWDLAALCRFCHMQRHGLS